MNRWTKSANSSDPWTFPLTLCSHSVLMTQWWVCTSKKLEARPHSCLNVEFDEALRSREATLDLDRLRARADAQAAATKI